MLKKKKQIISLQTWSLSRIVCATRGATLCIKAQFIISDYLRPRVMIICMKFENAFCVREKMLSRREIMFKIKFFKVHFIFQKCKKRHLKENVTYCCTVCNLSL